MFNINRATKNDDEPPLRERSKLPLLQKKWYIFLIVNMVIGVLIPAMAHECENDLIYYSWDYGTVRAPIILETTRTAVEEDPPEVKVVRSYGNGTCVPYVRARTGINMYGWAGTFLARASSSGYVVTEVPMEGSIVVTSESGGHVAVVEEVADIGIRVSEQNFKGLYVVSERTIPYDDPIILGYIR